MALARAITKVPMVMFLPHSSQKRSLRCAYIHRRHIIVTETPMFAGV
jgi:hypothetical protein